ncbi:MAG: branched-chain amino acid aminotransferase [Oscillospiraceae bacterium]|jgi:branched-chain amino acid aminotransferase|nr:branched-chain amino acid aminotransferase [Oscillospiraceae bacterium]
MEPLKLIRSTQLKEKPADNLGFGKYFTDHMFVMDYSTEKGWHSPRIEPFAPIELSPAAMCLHYGQEVFEGLKAYRRDDGGVQLFRPLDNFKRMNISCRRLVIPEFDTGSALEYLLELLRTEKDWVPSQPDSSLYIRPFIISTDPYVGVRPSSSYKFMIILSPSGPYYPSGLNPVDIYVERQYVRSVRGGVGEAKTAGNYAASLLAQSEAGKLNYSQVLWLDGIERKYIEEVGAMNIFFVTDGKVITPELQGSILPGITRRSVIDICKSFGIEVSERRISIDEVTAAHEEGRLEEVFGTGTAAVISPVGSLNYGGKIMEIGGKHIGPLSQRLYDTLTGIQCGKIPDSFSWTVPVC